MLFESLFCDLQLLFVKVFRECVYSPVAVFFVSAFESLTENVDFFSWGHFCVDFWICSKPFNLTAANRFSSLKKLYGPSS